MMVAFRYDNDAVGSLYYSREIPSLFRGLRLSKLFGREGVITFESNGAFVIVRGRSGLRLVVPGIRDIRGYQAMYRDFVRAIRSGGAPEMSLERAIEDQRLMDRIYETADQGTAAPPSVRPTSAGRTLSDPTAESPGRTLSGPPAESAAQTVSGPPDATGSGPT
jgi:predicted dehydrogenase